MLRQNSTVPKWDPDTKIWTYRPYIDGVQKKYTSRKPGPAGAAECKRKYNSALASENKNMIRFSEAWKKYLEHRADLLGQSEAVSKSRQYGKYYLLPRLKNKRMKDISKNDWQECINKAAPVKKDIERLSKKSLMNIRGEITCFCRFAYDGNMIDTMPLSLRIPKDAPVIGKKIIQPGLLVRFLNDDSDEWYLHAWQLMTVTGLRPGECYGLKQDDVSDGLIRVRRSITHNRQITGGKNDNAIRTLVQTDMAAKFIMQQLEMICRNEIDTEWLFPTPDGDMPCPSTITHHWDLYRRQFPDHITQHGLRHTFNSINKKLPEAWRKKIIGHSVDMDTDGIYGHEVDGEDIEIAEAVNATFTDIFKKTSTKQVLADKQKP